MCLDFGACLNLATQVGTQLEAKPPTRGFSHDFILLTGDMFDADDFKMEIHVSMCTCRACLILIVKVCRLTTKQQNDCPTQIATPCAHTHAHKLNCILSYKDKG